MAAPLLRGVGAYGSGTTSFVAAVPAGVSVGDAMYIIMESTDSATAAGTPTTPNGGSGGAFTKLFEQTFAAGVSGQVSTLTIFGKIAASGDAANVTVSGVLDHCSGAMVVVYSHGLSVIGDTVVGTAADHGVGQSSLSTPGITVIADSFIIGCIGFSDDANDTTNHSGETNANLASITERIDNTVSTGAGGGVGIWTATCAGTSTGATTWAHDTAVQSESLHLGIKPAAIQSTNGVATAAAFATVLAVALAVSQAAGIATAAAWVVPTAAAQASVEAAGVPVAVPWFAPDGSATSIYEAGADPASAAWAVPTAAAAHVSLTDGVPVVAPWAVPDGDALASVEAAGIPASAPWFAPDGDALASVEAAGIPASAPWAVSDAAAQVIAEGTIETVGVSTAASWSVPMAGAQKITPGAWQVVSGGVDVERLIREIPRRTVAGAAVLNWSVSDASAEQRESDEQVIQLVLVLR